MAEGNLKTPTKEILTTSGGIGQTYEILGSVEYDITGVSIYASNATMDGSPTADLQKQAQDGLRKVAFTKFGDRVDAIINVKILGSASGGLWGDVAGSFGANTGNVHSEGIAVAFPSSTGGRGKERR